PQLAGGVADAHTQLVDRLAQAPRCRVAQRQPGQGPEAANPGQTPCQPLYRPPVFLLRRARQPRVEFPQLAADRQRLVFQGRQGGFVVLPSLEVMPETRFQLVYQLALLWLVGQSAGRLQLFVGTVMQRPDLAVTVAQRRPQVLQRILQFVGNLVAAD